MCGHSLAGDDHGGSLDLTRPHGRTRCPPSLGLLSRIAVGTAVWEGEVASDLGAGPAVERAAWRIPDVKGSLRAWVHVDIPWRAVRPVGRPSYESPVVPVE